MYNILTLCLDLHISINEKTEIMKIRRRIKTTSTIKSKYRFSQQKIYIDLAGITYHYNGKYMDCFSFTTIKNGKSLNFSCYEKDLDLLQLTIKN